MVTASVVVLAYNVAPYLPKCLDSLVSQTLRDIEIVVVDNGSADSTADIVDRYQAHDDRVRLVRLEHESSPGTARNAGLDVAVGSYVIFVDGDDWLDFSYVEVMVGALEETRAQLVHSNVTVMYQDGVTKPKQKNLYERRYVLDADIALRIMAYELSSEVTFSASASCKLFRRDFLVDNDIRFQEGIFYEDQSFSYETLIRATKVVCEPGPTYRYLKRIGSITQSYTDAYADSMAKAYSRIRRLLEETGTYRQYRVCYHRSLEHCFNLIIRQIFEYVHDEESRKRHMRYAFTAFKDVIIIDEYLDICSSEEIRRHIQPLVTSTLIN